MATFFNGSVVTAFDANGTPAATATLTFYVTGTLVKAPIYTTSALDVEHANPISADSVGRFAPIYLDDGVVYRVILDYGDGSPTKDVDPYSGVDSGSTAGDYFTIKSGGALGDGVAIDTADMATVIADAAVIDGSEIVYTPGIYLTTGNALAQADGTRISTQGRAVLRAAPGATALLSVTGTPPDVLPAPRQGLPTWISGLEFDGNNPAYGYTVGTTGLLLGSSVYSIINYTMTNLFAHNCEFGFTDYAIQQSASYGARGYRNKVGRYVRTDPTNGGVTGTRDVNGVYQYNQVGVMLNNYPRISMARTCTLANSSTAVTNCDTTGMANGMYFEAPGVPANATITVTGGTTLTLSAATTATAAMANVPALISNRSGLTTDYVSEGAVIQGNYICGVAAYGMNNLSLSHLRTEANHDQSGLLVPITVENRTVPLHALYFYDSVVSVEGVCEFSEGGAWPSAVRAECGTTIAWIDTACPTTSTGAMTGDLTCNIAFYGEFHNARYWIDFPVSRWPDEISVSDKFFAFGNTSRQMTSDFKNFWRQGSPRTPLPQNINAATLGYAVDATKGPCTTMQFTAVAGSTSVNKHTFDISNAGALVKGDTVVFAVDIRADTYSSLSFGGQLWNGTLPMTPEWHTYNFVITLAVDLATVTQSFFPTNADGPKLYYTNAMVHVIPAGAPTEALSAIVHHGLINTGSLDGALMTTSAYTPALLAAAAYRNTKTVAVPAARVGDRVSVTYDSYDALYEWTGIVSANDVVTVIEHNASGAGITPAAGTLNVSVIPA